MAFITPTTGIDKNPNDPRRTKLSADANYVDINLWSGDEIYKKLTKLRDEDPIYWSEQTELWMITGYEEAEYVSKNQQIVTSAEGVRPK